MGSHFPPPGMVTRLNRLLSARCHKVQSIEAVQENCSNRGCSDDVESKLIQHLEVLYQANVCYTLKRGPVATTTEHSCTLYNQTAFRKLSTHLELTISEMLLAGHDARNNYQVSAASVVLIDRSVRTLIRLLNYRASSVWRPEKESTTLKDCCILLDDSESLIQLFDFLSESLHKFGTMKRTWNRRKIRNPRLAELRESSIEYMFGADNLLWTLERQLLKFRLIILPGVVRRVEIYTQHFIAKETKSVCSSCLSKDSFIGTFKNRSKEKMKFDSTEPNLGKLIIEMLDKKLFSPTELLMRKENFELIARMLSKGLNRSLKSILSHVLESKFRFDKQGIVLLYASLQKLQVWIIYIRQRMSESKLCPFENNELRIIRDVTPWVETNTILGILQTGNVLPNHSPSEELVESKSCKKDRENSTSYFSCSSVLPYGNSVKKRGKKGENMEENVLERPIPDQIKIRTTAVRSAESVILPIELNEEPKNASNSNLSFNKCGYANIRRSWILDSMKIHYHHVLMKTKNDALSYKEKFLWSQLAAKKNKKKKKSYLNFTSLSSYYSYCVELLPKHSSVSICVAIDVGIF